jgi:hypothetical protein
VDDPERIPAVGTQLPKLALVHPIESKHAADGIAFAVRGLNCGRAGGHRAAYRFLHHVRILERPLRVSVRSPIGINVLISIGLRFPAFAIMGLLPPTILVPGLPNSGSLSRRPFFVAAQLPCSSSALLFVDRRSLFRGVLPNCFREWPTLAYSAATAEAGDCAGFRCDRP